jgi:hypothetical protein
MYWACPSCGKQVDADRSHCWYCGHDGAGVRRQPDVPAPTARIGGLATGLAAAIGLNLVCLFFAVRSLSLAPIYLYGLLGPRNCRRDFVVGERYVMFSSDGRIPTDYCEPMYPADQSERRIERLDELAKKAAEAGRGDERGAKNR